MKGHRVFSPLSNSQIFNIQLFHQWEQRYGILQVSSFTNKAIADIHYSKVKAFGLNQDMVIVKNDGSEV